MDYQAIAVLNPVCDFLIRGNRAMHALSAQMVPIAFAAGLATTYAENDSKTLRTTQSQLGTACL